MRTVRTINRRLITNWILDNGRNGREHLAIRAKCSSSLIAQMLNPNANKVPKFDIRERLCAVIGASEDELFPLVSQPDQSEKISAIAR